MPAPKRPAARTPDDLEHQEQSIKVRKSQLFDEPGQVAAGPAVRPFREYLRETPADPLSNGLKAGLWAVAVLVTLLFFAALFTSRGAGRGAKPEAGAPESAATP